MFFIFILFYIIEINSLHIKGNISSSNIFIPITKFCFNENDGKLIYYFSSDYTIGEYKLYLINNEEKIDYYLNQNWDCNNIQENAIVFILNIIRDGLMVIIVVNIQLI